MKDNYLSKRVTLNTRNILKERNALNELPPYVPVRNIISKSVKATIKPSKMFILLATYYSIPRPIILIIISIAKINVKASLKSLKRLSLVASPSREKITVLKITHNKSIFSYTDD